LERSSKSFDKPAWSAKAYFADFPAKPAPAPAHKPAPAPESARKSYKRAPVYGLRLERQLQSEQSIVRLSYLVDNFAEYAKRQKRASYISKSACQRFWSLERAQALELGELFSSDTQERAERFLAQKLHARKVYQVIKYKSIEYRAKAYKVARLSPLWFSAGKIVDDFLILDDDDDKARAGLLSPITKEQEQEQELLRAQEYLQELLQAEQEQAESRL
jgi:hypothetical protein